MSIFSIFKRKRVNVEPQFGFKTRYGIINPSIKTYFDKSITTGCSSILTKYKIKTLFDTATFYAPYVPLQMVSANAAVVESDMWGWITFCFFDNCFETPVEVLAWCKDNLGRQHRGIYLYGIRTWLGNFGNWRYDYLGSGYIRIWVKNPEHITLIRLRWL